MCIAAPVGRGGKNDRDDVRTVQLLLNLNAPQVLGPTVADGRCGEDTIAAIEQFQRGVVGGKDAEGVVTCQPASAGQTGGAGQAGTTLRALRSGMALGFSAEKLQGIFIHAGASTVAGFFAHLLAGMAQAQLITPLRQAHFLAQVGHECGELRYTEEIASGAAYEGRKDLGNTRKGDGARFKGRGLIQITGRANYTVYGTARNANFVDGDAPFRIAKEPALAVDAAVWFWQTHKLNDLADKDDVLAITRRVNGGTNGLDDRKRILSRAKWFLDPGHTDPETIRLIQAMEEADEELDTIADAHRIATSRLKKPAAPKIVQPVTS